MLYDITSPITASLASDSWMPRGDVADHAWYQHIRWEDGKPHLEAIVILARIVYMYRRKFRNKGA